MVALLTKSLSGNGTTDPVILRKGDFNFSLRGSWSATVTLQRTFDDVVLVGSSGAAWENVSPTFSTNTTQAGTEPEGSTWYRVEVSGYTGGTVEIRIGQ